MAKPAKKPEKSAKSGEHIVAQNRAASYNYHILEKHEAGLVLHGTEVKALREGKANIRDAYVDLSPTARGSLTHTLHSTYREALGIMSPWDRANCSSTRGKSTSFPAAQSPRV